ncbi:MAG TPA: hypothetical protein PLK95_09775 [Pseudothermotoga sp.]|nr:hypothetical protein [Pseudothermotoga sp.]
MKEFIVLLKYGLKGSQRFVGKPSVRKRANVSGLFLPIIAIAVYGVPLGLLFYDLFKSLKDVIVGNVDLATLFVANWSVLMAGMFILSFVPSLVNSFVKNEEIQLLLTMPIRRSTIVLYQAILTSVLQSFSIVMYLFVVPTYALSTQRNFLMSIFVSLMMCFMLILLSILLAVLVGLWMRRSTARRMNVFALLVTVLIFIAVTQSLPQLNNINSSAVSLLTRTGHKLLSAFNPFVWPVLALNNYFYVFPLFLTTLVLWFVSLKISQQMTFEDKTVSSVKKSEKKFSHAGVFAKDLRLIFRYEQGIFMLIYPVAVSLIFAFTTKSFLTPLFIAIVISTMYVSMNSAMLMKQELAAWPLAKIMPLNTSQILMPKMIISPALYSLVMLALAAFLQAYFKLSWKFYLLVPIVFTMYVFASVLGVQFLLREKTKIQIANPSKILNTSHVFLVEGIVLGMTVGSVLPLTMYLYNRELLSKILKTDLLVHLIGVGLPLAMTVLFVLLIRRYSRRLFSMVDEIE